MRQITFAVTLVLSLTACMSQSAASRLTENLALTRERDELLRQRQDLRAEVLTLRRELTDGSDELARAAAEAATCRAELGGCNARLNEGQVATAAVIDEVRARCDSIAANCEVMRTQAVHEGQLTMLQSIEISGKPSRVDGVFFDDYYYTFEVRVAGKTFVLSKIRTEQEETMFTRALASIGDIVTLIGLRK